MEMAGTVKHSPLITPSASELFSFVRDVSGICLRISGFVAISAQCVDLIDTSITRSNGSTQFQTSSINSGGTMAKAEGARALRHKAAKGHDSDRHAEAFRRAVVSVAIRVRKAKTRVRKIQP